TASQRSPCQCRHGDRGRPIRTEGPRGRHVPEQAAGVEPVGLQADDIFGTGGASHDLAAGVDRQALCTATNATERMIGNSWWETATRPNRTVLSKARDRRAGVAAVTEDGRVAEAARPTRMVAAAPS